MASSAKAGIDCTRIAAAALCDPRAAPTNNNVGAAQLMYLEGTCRRRGT